MSAFGTLRAYHADISVKAEVEQMAAEVRGERKSVKSIFLINNAGMTGVMRSFLTK